MSSPIFNRRRETVKAQLILMACGYSFEDAALLLRVPASTLSRWRNHKFGRYPSQLAGFRERMFKLGGQLNRVVEISLADAKGTAA
jgi:hypothetical protein